MRTKGLPPSSGDSVTPPAPPHRQVSDHDEVPPPPALTSAAEAGLVLHRPVVHPSTVPSPPRTPIAASLETDQSPENGLEQPAVRSDSHTRFQVKTFMAALGTQENSNLQVEPPARPGAIAVAPPGRQRMRDSFESNPSAPSDPHIIAHLAPDEADVEARIAERLEGQIAKKVEERLRQDMQLATVVNNSDLAVAAEAKGSSTCCLKPRTICILLIVLMLVIGGTVGGVMYFQSPDEPTYAPTPTPILQLDPLVEELRAWIAPNDTDLMPFRNSSSPQSQALAWLKTDPITQSTGRSTRTVLERYVLAVLYYTASGASWVFRYLSSTGVCKWNSGSGTLDTDNELGVYCANDGVNVDTLTLDNNNLRGSLPWELVLLTNLEFIIFDNNRLTGRIPTRIGELTQLQLFWATSNALTGPLPRTFSPYTWDIDLSDNALTGSIPWNWATKMPELESVSLSMNALRGSLPKTFGQLVNLTTFDISFNQLTGTIPSQLGNIYPLESFDFSGNSITGSVDNFFCGVFAWVALVADCDEVDCHCCTKCCYDNNTACYNIR